LRLALLSVFLALPLLAEELPWCAGGAPAPDKKCRPVSEMKAAITTDQKLDYQRARANLVQLQSQVAAAQKTLEDSIAAL